MLCRNLFTGELENRVEGFVLKSFLYFEMLFPHPPPPVLKKQTKNKKKTKKKTENKLNKYKLLQPCTPAQCFQYWSLDGYTR